MIPVQLEKLITEGKAQFKSASLGASQQVVLPVPRNGYIVIYEYWYKPFLGDFLGNALGTNCFQYVNFSNTEIFIPVQHFLPPGSVVDPATDLYRNSYGLIDHQYRSVYITARKDISVFFTQSFDSPPTPGQTEIDNLIQSNPAIVNGYIGQNIITGLRNYHTGALPAATFGYIPLSENYTQFYLGGATFSFDRLFFTPQNGRIEVNDATTSIQKAAMPHIQINYVEVYMEPVQTFNP
jgi:hypothetical protein